MCAIKWDENVQTSVLNTRIANVYYRAEKCRDRSTSDELQLAVLHTGERLLTTIPARIF